MAWSGYESHGCLQQMENSADFADFMDMPIAIHSGEHVHSPASACSFSISHCYPLLSCRIWTPFGKTRSLQCKEWLNWRLGPSPPSDTALLRFKQLALLGIAMAVNLNLIAWPMGIEPHPTVFCWIRHDPPQDAERESLVAEYNEEAPMCRMDHG